MTLMLRAVVLATLFFVIPRAAAGQPLSDFHMKVVLVDADRKATPVPHHALFVRDNPATAGGEVIVIGICLGGAARRFGSRPRREPSATEPTLPSRDSDGVP